MDDYTLRFFQAANLHHGAEGTWIEQLLLSELPKIIADQPAFISTPGSCLFANVGEYILRLLRILVQFAKGLVHGEKLKAYAAEKLGDAVVEHDLSDLEMVDYLEEKHQVLKLVPNLFLMHILIHHRAISLELESATRTCAQLWTDSPHLPAMESPLHDPHSGAANIYNTHPPSTDIFPSSSSSLAANIRRPSTIAVPLLSATTTSMSPSFVPPVLTGHPSSTAYNPSQQPDSPSTSDSNQTVPDAASETEDSFLAPLQNIRTRGKGVYTCPKGLNCDKGGVNDNGEMIVFKQNSAFRSVVLDLCYSNTCSIHC